MSTYMLETDAREEPTLDQLATLRCQLMDQVREVDQRIICLIVAAYGPGLPKILQAVARKFNVTAGEIIHKDRTEKVTIARFAFCYLARKHTEESFSEIARVLHRHHGAVQNAIKNAANMLETDPEFRRAILRIEEKLLEQE